MQPCVQFHSVTTALGGRRVLDGIDLALPVGQVSAVIGESGSGKSTLLNHVNGMLRPDAGEVRVFGQAVPTGDLVAFRRRIGYAVQGVGLFPHLRALDNVTLLARLEAWPVERIDARVDELLALFGLERSHATRYPHELSGGQQQRIGLCRAMMLAPPLLLLDEPFSGVDPMTRQEIHDQFLALRRGDDEPGSVLLVTHDIGEALRLGEFLVFVSAGRIVQAGPRAEVQNAPGNATIARLLEGHAP